MRTSIIVLLFLASALLSAGPPTPNSPNHGFSVTYVDTTDSFLLDWWGKDKYIYFLQHSPDIEAWSFFPIYEIGSDGALSWGFSTNQDVMFFRLSGSNDPDSKMLGSDYSGAGLSAWQQIQMGFNPFEWIDLDADTIHDAWEIFYFGNLQADLSADLEPDGLSNSAEFLEGTNPNSADHPAVQLSVFHITGSKYE